ncbi:MAG: hypothetical protein CMI16_05795 [Opitutaceae bacterium]|nr:hypothetical protein [Opitutaceae bacterium]|tara:strand:+ start:164 stop:598 length:435 start_codon:yes stop_codon:yes gene_type:complete
MSTSENRGEWHAERVAHSVLGKIREIDEDARVQSVTPSALFSKDGGTVLRVTPRNASGVRICQLVRNTWPLTTATCVECSLSGNTIVQVFVPGHGELKRNAQSLVEEMNYVVRILGKLIQVSALALVVVITLAVVTHTDARHKV